MPNRPESVPVHICRMKNTGPRPLKTAAIIALCIGLFPLVSVSNEGDLSATGSVAFGSLEDVGFGVGAIGAVGWGLDHVFSLGLQGGGGGGEDLSGESGAFGHLEIIIPAGVNICANVPRVCPGLEFDLSFFPGAGYGWYSGKDALNLVAGVALDSFRRAEKVDIGVRAAVLAYFDVLEMDALVTMMLLQLGVILRWPDLMKKESR